MNRRTFITSLIALPAGIAAAVKLSAAPAPKLIGWDPALPGSERMSVWAMQPYQREVFDAMMRAKRPVVLIKPRNLGYDYWVRGYSGRNIQIL